MHLSMATATGSLHTNPGKPGTRNNQDAMTQRMLSNGEVVVICDGCGDRPKSEFGAEIGANIIANLIKQQLANGDEINWDLLTKDTTEAIRAEAQKFTHDDSVDEFEYVIVERFLFTVMVVVVVDGKATIASFGDGMVIFDDEVVVIEPPIGNAPPYISYRLLRDSGYHKKGMEKQLYCDYKRDQPLSASCC